MTGVRFAAALLCAVALASCVSVPKGKSPPPAALSAQAQATAMAGQQARESALAASAGLEFSARAAMSNGRDGGSGRIEWRQTGDHYAVTLSAPVTRQSWTLVGDAGDVRLDGLEGGRRSGTDGSRLLREATGLEVPVDALASWASGARADTARFGAAQLQFTADGRLQRIEQAGWVVDYLGWQDGTSDTGAGMIVLPDRINAERASTGHGAARVRLAIDSWQLLPTTRPANRTTPVPETPSGH